MFRLWIVSLLVVAVCIGYIMIDRFDPEEIKGRRVVITGASAGIGEQIAYHYCRLGADLLITARTEAKLKKVIDKCKVLGGSKNRYFYKTETMSDLNATKRVVQDAVDRLGGVDVLVLNHITYSPVKAWQGNHEDLENLNNVIDVNFKSYVHLTSHAMPHLRDSHGSIIVVSSVTGQLGMPNTAAYGSSKFAVNGFFGSLRQEFIMENVDISVTVAIIGLIGTENAKRNLKESGFVKVLKTVEPASPTDCALAIIKGGTLKQRQVYFPYIEALGVTMLRDWIPSVFEAVSRHLYSDEDIL